MTLFIKLEEGSPMGHPIVESNFRKIFSKTSFPKYFTPSVVEPLGYGIYDFAAQPEIGKYQKVVEVAPVKDEQGIYRQTWSIVDMDDEEKALEDERKEQEVRAKRDWELTKTDWTVLADSPLTDVQISEMTTYRQALRDITDHANFPYLDDADWPTKPV